MFLNAGQVESFSIDLPGIYDLRNPHEVKTSVHVPRDPGWNSP